MNRFAEYLREVAVSFEKTFPTQLCWRRSGKGARTALSASGARSKLETPTHFDSIGHMTFAADKAVRAPT